MFTRTMRVLSAVCLALSLSAEVFAQPAVRERATESKRNASGHDAIGAEHADRHVGDVHGAAAPTANARVATHDLGEEPV